MKHCYCPNCGRIQTVALQPPSKAIMQCPECGKSLMVKLDKNGIIIKALIMPATESASKQN